MKVTCRQAIEMTWFLAAIVCLQSDWPQWGGPHRDFRVGSSIGDISQVQPLQKIWEQEEAGGYAGLVVSAGVLISMSRSGEDELVVARDAGTGEPLWHYQYSAPQLDFQAISQYAPGPHSTPCISGNFVCAVGGTGVLNVLNRDNGELIWTRDLWNEYEATQLTSGYAASPIVVEQLLIVPVGGVGTGVIAFELASGREAWRATSCKAAYASPMLTEIAGEQHLVCLMDQQLVALDPCTGRILWQYECPAERTVHVASPLILPNNHVFLASSKSATLIRIEAETANQFRVQRIWESQAIRPQVGNTILQDQQILGPSTNTRTALLTGIDLASGNRVWRSRISGAGFLYRFDDGFMAISETGQLSFNRMTNGELKTVAVHPETFSGRIWNTAAVVDDKLFMRDDSRILGFQLGREVDR